MRTLTCHTQPVRSLCYSPDSRWLASGGDDGRVCLWSLDLDAERPEELPRRETGSGDFPGVEALEWLDARVLVVGDAAGRLVRWDVPERQVLAETQAHPRFGVRSLLHAPGEDLLVSLGWDQSARLWKASTLKPITHRGRGGARRRLALEGSEGQPLSVGCLLPGGKTLVTSGADGVLRFHDLAAGQLRQTLKGADPVTALAGWSALLAVGTSSGPIHLWDLEGRAVRATLLGHDWTVRSLAFASAGRLLLSASVDGTVRVWGVAGASQLRVYRWHERWVTCLALSPDGMTAAAGSEDRTIVVWDLADLD